MRRFSGVLFFPCWGNLLPDSETHINLSYPQVETNKDFMKRVSHKKITDGFWLTGSEVSLLLVLRASSGVSHVMCKILLPVATLFRKVDAAACKLKYLRQSSNSVNKRGGACVRSLPC